MEQLRGWINQQCEAANMTWREASIRAGLNPGAISAIMNGQKPGLETCKALAGLFHVSPEYVLRLAGHLPPLPNNGDFDPAVQADLDEIRQIVSNLPPDMREPFTDQLLQLSRGMKRMIHPEDHEENESAA